MLQSYFRYSLLGPYDDPASDGYEQVPSQKEGRSCDTVGNRHSCGCVCLRLLFHECGVGNKNYARSDSSSPHIRGRVLPEQKRIIYLGSPSLVEGPSTGCQPERTYLSSRRRRGTSRKPNACGRDHYQRGISELQPEIQHKRKQGHRT